MSSLADAVALVKRLGRVTRLSPAKRTAVTQNE